MLALAHKYAQRDEQEWGALFHTILQSRIRDWYRRNRVRRRWRVWLGLEPDGEGPDPLENLPANDGPRPERDAAGHDAVAALELALGRLPLRQQQAVVLRVWEGMDVAGTARVMGVSQGAVKTHYSRAVHKLRELLGEHEL
jgi:RNA polymerase sigma-70 factor (ECF subfamily)